MPDESGHSATLEPVVWPAAARDWASNQSNGGIGKTELAVADGVRDCVCVGVEAGDAVTDDVAVLDAVVRCEMVCESVRLAVFDGVALEVRVRLCVWLALGVCDGVLDPVCEPVVVTVGVAVDDWLHASDTGTKFASPGTLAKRDEPGASTVHRQYTVNDLPQPGEGSAMIG